MYVDQSKASLEKGGVATLDAFMGLAPSDKVLVKAANFPTKPPPKGKGPFIRCVPMKPGGSTALEVSNVNSVEKVYRILTKHMGLSVRRSISKHHQRNIRNKKRKPPIQTHSWYNKKPIDDTTGYYSANV